VLSTRAWFLPQARVEKVTLWHRLVDRSTRFFSEMGSEVEVQWLTAWAELANRFISPMLGLPSYEVAGSPDWDAPAWWKLAIAQRLWERDHTPFVWLDDDIVFYPEAEDWLATLEEGKDFLAISSDVNEGLRQEHLDQIAAFVKDHSAERDQASSR
jgi:hypothetical protein